MQTIDEPVEYIGSDESGKGDIFGPLVTAAVFVNASSKNKLDKFGIRDSKDLSDNLISELASKIKTITGNVFSIVLISPAKYNELYDKFKNLNKILNWSHSKAIETILEKSNCNTVITDKFSNKDLTVTEKATYSRINFIQTPKAEKYTAVAAASILARDSFNKWFNNQKKLGYNLPKGASEKVDETVYDIFNREGIETLRTLTKMHFKTIKKIIH
ncbi:MAG: ribonuclease HIII [Ignavibacteria bacterium RBG_13_36_8]|nr:MAG: ribonuclease HIII [Ignavibacteria bacterium RBG_13_36_8]